MASTGQIDEIVSDKAFQQLEQVETYLSTLNLTLTESVKKAKALSDALAGAKGLREIQTSSANAAKEIERLNKITAQTVTAQQQAARATALNEQAQIRLTQTQQKAQQQAEKQAAAAKKSASAYQILNSAYQEATQLARDAGARFGETSTQFQNAAKSANFLRERLDAIDKPLGNYQRNVGNYASGFNGLQNAINQITREAPAFAVSLQTGFLAISNNLPILFDQISQTRAEVARLRAEGQQTPGVLSKLATSFFSLGTALSLGVTLLTVYGKDIVEFIKSIFKGTDALNEITEKQKNFAEALKGTDFKKASTEVIELKTNFDLAREGLLKKSDVLKQYNENLGDSLGKTTSFNEAERLLNEKSATFIKVTFLKAQAQAALSQAVNLANQELAIQQEGLNVGDALKGYFSSFGNIARGLTGQLPNFADALPFGEKRLEEERKSLQKQSEFYKKYFEELQKQAATEAAKGGLNFFDNKGDKNSGDSLKVQLLKLQQARIKVAQETDKAIIDDETLSYNIRLDALSRYNNDAKDLINIDKNIKLSDSDLTATQIETIETEAYGERIKQQSDYEQQRLKLNQEAGKKLLDYFIKTQTDIAKAAKETTKTRIDQSNADSLAELDAITQNSQDQLTELERSYAKGEISKAQYEKRKLDIEHEAARKSIVEQINLANTLISLQEAAGLDQTEQRKKLSELTRKLAKEDADYEINQIKTVAEAKKAQNEAIKELAQEVFNFGVSLVNAGYENEKNALQQRQDDIDVQKEKDIAEVDRQLLTEQQKADKIAVINAKAQAQKDLLDARKRQVEQRQARFDKAVSLAAVVQNTYAGASRALKDYPFPFSSIIAGLVIATGLAQAAQIIATPIPKYAKGTNYHKGGAMIVGDAGTELVIEPNGRKYLTPDTDTLTAAPIGTKVIPNHEVIKMLAKPDKIHYAGGQSIDIQQLVIAQKQTTKAIKAQKTPTTIITKKGWINRQIEVNSWSNHKRNHFN